MPDASTATRRVFDPSHDVPVLARKSGALRNGAPFKDWVLSGGLDRNRRKRAGSADGNRQMASNLTAALSDGLPAADGNRAGMAAWSLLFYALWHRALVEARPVGGDRRNPARTMPPCWPA